jgi:hypothetical protein
MSPFDFLNAINSKAKTDVMTGTDDDQRAEADYVPYVVNRSLSYFPETVLLSNEMNRQPFLDKKLQFHFLLNSIRPGKRFAKWIKREDSEDLELVKLYYQYSDEKARQALPLLSETQLSIIRRTLTDGVKDEFSRPTD